MNNEQFNEIFTNTMSICENVLCKKAGEYADDTDRLHNFKQAANLQLCTPIRALGGMMAKHTVSVYDLIERVEQGFTVSPELWDEKIVDSINYLILLRAMVQDQADETARYIAEDDKYHCDYLER